MISAICFHCEEEEHWQEKEPVKFGCRGVITFLESVSIKI